MLAVAAGRGKFDGIPGRLGKLREHRRRRIQIFQASVCLVIEGCSRLDDRNVAGAAAQIAGQAVTHLRLVEPLALLQHARHRHDKTGRAKAALRAVTVDHGLLHGTELAVGGKALDRDDVRAVQLEHKLDTGVDALVLEASVAQATDQHGTGATVAFAADDFRTDQPQLVPQKIGQRQQRLARCYLVGTSVDVEENLITHETNTFTPCAQFRPN